MWQWILGSQSNVTIRLLWGTEGPSTSALLLELPTSRTTEEKLDCSFVENALLMFFWKVVPCPPPLGPPLRPPWTRSDTKSLLENLYDDVRAVNDFVEFVPNPLAHPSAKDVLTLGVFQAFHILVYQITVLFSVVSVLSLGSWINKVLKGRYQVGLQQVVNFPLFPFKTNIAFLSRLYRILNSV